MGRPATCYTSGLPFQGLIRGFAWPRRGHEPRVCRAFSGGTEPGLLVRAPALEPPLANQLREGLFLSRKGSGFLVVLERMRGCPQIFLPMMLAIPIPFRLMVPQRTTVEVAVRS